MSKVKDLTGQRFGRLMVIEDSGKRNHKIVMWKCQCDCGNVCEVRSDKLRSGNTQSCGCLQQEVASRPSDQHENTRLSLLSGRKINRNNKSGNTGVSWNKRCQQWQVGIKIKGKSHYLGLFANKRDAINARKEGEEKYFKPILEKYGDPKGGEAIDSRTNVQ